MKKGHLFVYAIILLVAVFGFFVVNNTNKKEIDVPKCIDCNVIIIVPTNVGAKHMSLYGYSRDTTPNIKNFAKDSIVFTNAFSTISWSLPAAASLFTSEYPFTHGLMGRAVLDQNEVTLAEILKIYNYTTLAFTGGGDYKSIYGIHKGFDIFDDNDNSAVFTGSFNRSAKAAIDWLKDNKGKKFFMFVEGYDAHCPFNPPLEYRFLYEKSYKGILNDSLCVRSVDKETKSSKATGDYIEAVYFGNMTISPIYAVFIPVNVTKKDIGHLRAMHDAEIMYVDDLIASFLEELKQFGILGKTIIVIVGDHGEIIGEHETLIRFGFLRGTLYDEVIHVPLIIKHPFIKNGKRMDSLAQTIDVMPTALDFLGIPVNRQAQGKSLLPIIEGKNYTVHDYIFSGGRFGSGGSELFPYVTFHTSVRSNKWKLIFERTQDGQIFTFELYDMENDPNENNNLIAQRPEIVSDLKHKLDAWELRTIRARVLKKAKLTDEELKAAREAGYFN